MTRRERDRLRYATNPESRTRQRERQNLWFRERYADDDEFRERHRAKVAEWQWLYNGIR